MEFDLIVIGSGPGGYHAAIRAAQLGLNVACVEKEYVGGVCLNVGCIPTKALLHVAAEIRNGKDAEAIGVKFAEPTIDLKAVTSFKDQVVKKMTGGVGMLFKGNKVKLLEGTASFVDDKTVQVGDEKHSAKAFVVATGSSPVVIPGFELEDGRIIDSTGALELRRALEAHGIEFHTGTTVVSQKSGKKGTDVELQAPGGEATTVQVDRVLVAVGRRPNGRGLGLEEIGVELDERGYVKVVNEHMQTTLPHVYAIGDVARAPLLAHKAMKEGLVAAEHAAGQPSAYDTVVPSVIYTSPELASVGMTEKEAEEAGHRVRIGRFPLSASGRAASLGVDSGLVKLIGDAETDLLLGCHIVAPNAGERSAEATLAIEMGATLEDLALTQHAHPTLSEGLMEAAEHAHGRAIHIANRRR